MDRTRTTTARLDDIADAAAQLFLDKGFDATSMSDLAAATGLGKSSLYHHLSGKEELLAHICGRTMAELREGLDEVLGSDGPAIDRLAAALSHAARTALDHLAATNLILTLRPTTVTGREVLAGRREQERMLADLVGQAQQEGSARRDIDALLLTRLVLGTINGLVAWYRPESSDVDPEVVHGALVATMLAAVRPDGTGTGD